MIEYEPKNRKRRCIPVGRALCLFLCVFVFISIGCASALAAQDFPAFASGYGTDSDDMIYELYTYEAEETTEQYSLDETETLEVLLQIEENMHDIYTLQWWTLVIPMACLLVYILVRPLMAFFSR